MSETASRSFSDLVPVASSRLEHSGYGGSLGDRAIWNLWVACKVCSYLPAVDMLNYLRAVEPGGLAERQVQRVYDAKEYIEATCEMVPLVGKPAFEATGAIVATASSYAAPAAATVYSLAVQRLPAEHLLLWTLAAANGARQVEYFVRAQSAQHGGLAGGSKALAQQAAHLAWAAATDAVTSRLPLGFFGKLASIPENDEEMDDDSNGDEKRTSRVNATNLLRDLPGRAVAVVGAAAGHEVQQWLQALVNLLGGERLVLALPLLGAMAPESMSAEASRHSARSSLSSGGSKAARAARTDRQRAIASEDAYAAAAVAANDEEEEEEAIDGAMSPAPGEEPRAPPGSPEAHDQDLGAYGGRRGAWQRVSALPRAARQRLVGAVTLRVRQWAPGGVVTLYDTVYDRLVYHAPTDQTSLESFPSGGGAEPTEAGTGVEAVAARGSSTIAAASGSFVAPGRPPSSPEEADAASTRDVPGAEASGAASAAATAAAEAEAKALGNRVAEVRRLGALEGMALVTAYRERLPSGGAFGFDLRPRPVETATATKESAVVPLPQGPGTEGISLELERSRDVGPIAVASDEAPREFFDSSSNNIANDGSSGLAEIGEHMNLLSPRSLKRMQRMMHYEVSVAPFSVTLELPDHGNGVGYDPSDLSELQSSSTSSFCQRGGTVSSSSSSSSRSRDHLMKLDSFGGQGSRSSSGEVVEESSPSIGGERGSASGGSAPRKPSPSSGGGVASSVGTPGGSPLGQPRPKTRRKRKNRGGRRSSDPGSGGGSGSGGADSTGVGGDASNAAAAGGAATGAGAGSSEKCATSVEHSGGAPVQASSSSSSSSSITTTTTAIQGGGGRSVRTVLCTPQSFPPSPMFRAVVLARSHGAADDVVYAARDALRRALQLQHYDGNVRAVAAYLERRHALATFNPADAHPAISLSRARHAASCRQLPPTLPPAAPQQESTDSTAEGVEGSGAGLGSTVAASGARLPASGCASVRGVVPVLHNRYVYLQFSILAAPPPLDSNTNVSGSDDVVMVVGLSTSGMPLDCAPGACAHSIGLTTDGRLLVGGRTYGAFAAPPATANPSGFQDTTATKTTTAEAAAVVSPEEELTQSRPPRRMEFGAGSTVGMLVFRDNDAEDDEEASAATSSGGWAAVWAAFTVDGTAVTCVELTEGTAGGGPGSNSPRGSGGGDNNEGFGGSLVRLLVPRNAVVFPTATFVCSSSSSMSSSTTDSTRSTSGSSGSSGTGGGPQCRLTVRGRFSAGDLVGDDRPGILSGQPGAASPKPGVPTPDPCAARAAPPDCTVYALDGSIVRMPLVLPLNDTE